MTSSSPVHAEFDDHLRPDTPLASQRPTLATHLNFESPDCLMTEEQPFATSLADTLQLPPSTDGPPQLLLPVPASPPRSRPLHIFSLSDLLDGTGGLETLGPEIAAADINIASKLCFFTVPSGSFSSSFRRWQIH